VYALIQTGGKQYKVSEGTILKVEKLMGEAGDRIVLEQVLMINDGNGTTQIGNPLLENARVTAKILEVNLPAVVTVLGDINEPRIPSVTQILKAGRKPKEVLELDELELDLPALPQIKTLSNLAPETNRKQIKVGSVEELIQALKSEGVI
jgi:ribosomal protein L21